MSRRLGAYVLAGDPTWIRTTIAAYYDHLEVLVVATSRDGRGWTGSPIPVEECLAAIGEVDPRRIVRVIRGDWVDRIAPMAADTAQRQAALDAVGGDVDWVLQLDTDELLPDPEALFQVLDLAAERGVDAVEWPMRVLFRRLRDGRYLEVTASDGDRFEYPGPVAVRPGIRLTDARRASGAFLRPVVSGDDQSLQIVRPAELSEIRAPVIQASSAILHNSWARDRRTVLQKVRSWGHGGTLRARLYYWLVWLPAPWTWRVLRNFHPFAPRLWPRLGVLEQPLDLDPRDN